MKLIKILHYGSGNTGSILSCLSSIGYPGSIVKEDKDIIDSDLIILPGVGSSKAALKNIYKNNHFDSLDKRFKARKPILGICLGCQMPFHFLEESNSLGFEWIEGSVKKLPSSISFNNGWCRLNFSELKNLGLSRGLTKNATFYFNHQYYISRKNKIKSVCIRDLDFVPAIFFFYSICGIQFHPEKSQEAGKILLRNLLEDHYGF